MKKTLRILSLVLAALLMLTACGKVETPPVQATRTPSSTVRSPRFPSSSPQSRILTTLSPISQ